MGGYDIAIVGDNFAPTGLALACLWGARVTSATFINVSAVACAPPAVNAPQTVGVSLATAYAVGAPLPSTTIDSDTGLPVLTAPPSSAAAPPRAARRTTQRTRPCPHRLRASGG